MQEIYNSYSKVAPCRGQKSNNEEARTPFVEMPQRDIPSFSSKSSQIMSLKTNGMQDIYNCNVKITDLGRHKRVREARKLFDKMPQRDVVTYASMINVYLKNGDLENAEKLYHAIPGNSVVASSAMIDGYAKVNRIEEARRVFDSMPERNVFSWTSLVSGYLKVGHMDEAKCLFDRMPDKNIVSWTTMILGLARNGFIGDARRYFSHMPEKNVVAWTVMIKSLVENDHIDEARKLFDEMPMRNLYSWNIMLSGYLDENRVNEAIQLFKLMPQRNAVSWTTMVTGLARNRLTKKAREYFDQMPSKDIAAWNAMITAYVDEGLMILASDLFQSMQERNTVTWNAIIDGYSKNGPQDEALNQLNLMLRSGDRPNETTMTSVVPACGSRLQLMQAHTLVILIGFESDTSLTNALITMYSRCGDIPSARDAFKNLKVKDIVSWTAMMLAYSNHGYGHHALQAFSCMLRSGVKPDHITFVAVLSACSHAGLLEKGQRLFSSMTQTYGLEPKAEHYSCLVDILGRSGCVNEALKVVNNMPPDKRDGAVLGALLGACKSHRDINVANQIAEELIELEPTSSGSYMLLANVYAQHGKWNAFASVRKRMNERKVKKIPGYSQIEVDHKSHLFFSGDRSHPQAKELRELLQDELVPQMKEIPYLQEFPLIDL
ncbi:Pentatricopeptide repeat-containing protein [Thalictrum thalictroides]|uniref:Pentatricopeptide repeat-containing protein n=1 Tax=Thalictrum thalictroides TaxID=46969 RepID=A0A7J6VNA0_THATH|nr:Pentatricopeptide repeat-containing protein [Thalictrum thalictroides]